MFLIPPPPSWRLTEQKSWLNFLQLSLLPTDLHDKFSGRNKTTPHPFLLLLFYPGVLWSSVPQAETGILPNFGIDVSKLCCNLFESFMLLRNSKQTLGLWISADTRSKIVHFWTAEVVICPLFTFLLASYGKELVALLLFTEILVI